MTMTSAHVPLSDPASVGKGPREQFFSIDGFEFSDGVFEGLYSLVEGDQTHTFRERIDFREVSVDSIPSQGLLRLLTLACSLSYFKATTMNDIQVQFPLSESELHFLTSLIRNGLAEYAYRNDLPEKLTPSISGDIRPSISDDARRDWRIDRRPLVAVGGGKDSVVTIEALKLAGMSPLLFSVNQFGPIDRCVEVSGCDYVRVTRRIDPQLRVLNELGAPNGHVPVTAINSLIGLLIADIGGYGPTVMSNEGSANFGNLTWHGLEVNHQWSKSLEFEDLLRSALVDHGLEEDRYFSLLRLFSEIQITERFAHYPEYFSAFTSCNRVFTIDPAARKTTWCGECPKCHFVFLVLAPFISRQQLTEIFGRNLLDDLTNISPYEEIVGIRGNKPFECVGEYDEAAEAFDRLSAQPDWSSDVVVRALAGKRRQEAESPANHLAVDRVPVLYQKARDGVA